MLEACDLFSHVDSDDALGIEEASSSLGSVDADEVPKSGDRDREPFRFFCSRDKDRARLDGASDTVDLAVPLTFVEPEFMGSSPQFDLVDSSSLEGVAVPEVDLLVCAERPLAAWAYEKAEADDASLAGLRLVDDILR
jgi:hypothetical protein